MFIGSEAPGTSQECYDWVQAQHRAYEERPDTAIRPTVVTAVLSLSGITPQVLMVQSSKCSSGRLMLPQGGIDAGETPAMAARRELEEELGVSRQLPLETYNDGRWLDVGGRQRDNWQGKGYIGVVLVGRKAEIATTPDDTEVTTPQWPCINEVIDQDLTHGKTANLALLNWVRNSPIR